MTTNPPPYTPLPTPVYPAQQQYGKQDGGKNGGYHETDSESAKLSGQNIYPMMSAPPGGYNSTDSAIVSQPHAVAADYYHEEYPSNTAALVLSWVVCFFCCCLFGCIGLFYAASAPGSGSAENARRHIRIAYQFSVAGLIIGTVLYVMGTVIQVTVNTHHLSG